MFNCTLFTLLLVLFVLYSKSSSQSTTRRNDGELQTLLTIKQDWGNPAPLSSWNSSASSTRCEWTGVTCTNGHVTALSLPKLHIANQIPPSICNLTNLSYLDLSYNNLSSEFPTALYGCSALQYLDLSNNNFAGVLPDDMNILSSQLQHLNLSRNYFTGDVPLAVSGLTMLKSLRLDTNLFNGRYPAAEICSLADLETLTLANNPFQPAPVPGEFGKLTKLTYLRASGINMTGEVPDSLSSLKQLTMLDLSENKLQGKIPEWVWQLEKLEYLYMSSNNFTGEIGPNVTAMNLREIDLSMNVLTGSIPEVLGEMKNLTVLMLYNNQLTGPIPASVGLLPDLYYISLFNNKLSGELPPELGKHSPLGNFEVSNNNLSGELPEALCLNQKLYDIVVYNNNFSGPLPANLGNCTTLDNVMLYNNHFTGEFPQKIWSFPKLTTVMIHNNDFTGALPAEISSNISLVQMGNNRFSGSIPTSAINLQKFQAENNLLAGELPADMTKLGNLTDLVLPRNKISGAIPPSIGTLKNLNNLNLSGNWISGEILPGIGLLPALTMLDLSDNELTGSIPEDFNNRHFNSLNLSSNQLTGQIPSMLQISAYDGSFLGNRGLCAAQNANIKLPACSSGGLSKDLIIVFSGLAGIAVIGIAVIGCLLLQRQKDRQDLTIREMISFGTLNFTESDILRNLREENVIGSGGSGKVYRIHLGGDKEGGSSDNMVAVKRIWNASKVDSKLDKEFESEVKILGDIRHNNIVKLLCCISSLDAKLLVYEYMENGSLDRWLHHRERLGSPAPLDWPTRLAIAIDAATGLCYMHHDCIQPVVHRDVKSSNILLDPNFRARIADFGLARILVRSGELKSVSAIGGTFGYMAPEYMVTAKVNEKVDVYSFGVVLLELTTGRMANDRSMDCCLVEWAWQRFTRGAPFDDVVDKNIQDLACLEDTVVVFTLGVICTGEHPSSRPSMKEVLHRLLQCDQTTSEASSGVLLETKRSSSKRQSLSDTGERDANIGSCHLVVNVV